MKKEEKKKIALQGFLNNLWEACENGQQFNIAKMQAQHNMSGEYVRFITKHVITRKKGISSTYSIKPNWNKDKLISKLSSMSIKTVKTFLNSDVVSPSSFMKHLNNGDVIAKVHRFESFDNNSKLNKLAKVEHSTKNEVAKLSTHSAIEIDDLSGREIQDATIKVTVSRMYSGGSDSTSFEVKPSVSYSQILSLVTPLKK